jgi:hypothetical protein
MTNNMQLTFYLGVAEAMSMQSNIALACKAGTPGWRKGMAWGRRSTREGVKSL